MPVKTNHFNHCRFQARIKSLRVWTKMPPDGQTILTCVGLDPVTVGDRNPADPLVGPGGLGV